MSAKKPPAKKHAAALDAYCGKRNFSDTPEPRAKTTLGEGRSFVVQEHHARSRSGDLQAALKSGQEERIAFVAFDLLHLDGRNLCELPLSQRFDELKKLVGEESVRLRLSKVWSGSEGADLFRQGSFVGLREDKPATEVHLDAIATTGPRENPMKVAGITITHPDRIVYPADGITKMEVARYYERVADFMLPHLLNRPLALLRAPSGIRGDLFFQKSFSNHIPDQVTQKELADGTTILFIRNTRGIIALAQLGAIEFHPWGSRMPYPEKPDQLIWDLDPDSAVPWPEVLGAAFLIRDFLAEHGLHALVKTSGGKGLHLAPEPQLVPKALLRRLTGKE